MLYKRISLPSILACSDAGPPLPSITLNSINAWLKKYPGRKINTLHGHINLIISFPGFLTSSGPSYSINANLSAWNATQRSSEACHTRISRDSAGYGLSSIRNNPWHSLHTTAHLVCVFIFVPEPNINHGHLSIIIYLSPYFPFKPREFTEQTVRRLCNLEVSFWRFYAGKSISPRFPVTFGMKTQTLVCKWPWQPSMSPPHLTLQYTSTMSPSFLWPSQTGPHSVQEQIMGLPRPRALPPLQLLPSNHPQILI